MPFTTTCTAPVVSKCGWALHSLTRPCVAHRVWTMPVVAGRVATATPPAPLSSPFEERSATGERRLSRVATARTDALAACGDEAQPAMKRVDHLDGGADDRR